MPDIKEKLVEVLADYYGVAPAHFNIATPGIADHLIANGVTIQKWISVEERLPESDGFYLTYREDDVRVTWYGSGGLWRHIWNNDVTHWMPLPEPPKGE